MDDEELCVLYDGRYANYDPIGQIDVPESGLTLSTPLTIGEHRFDVVEPFLTLQPGHYEFVVSPLIGAGPVRTVQYLDFVAAEPAG